MAVKRPPRATLGGVSDNPETWHAPRRVLAVLLAIGFGACAFWRVDRRTAEERCYASGGVWESEHQACIDDSRSFRDAPY